MRSPQPPDPEENFEAGRHSPAWESDLEEALLRLVLRSPSAELDARVWRTLRRPQTAGRFRTACLAIAASVAVAAGSVPLLARFLQTAPVQKVVDRRSVTPSHPKSAAGPLRVERQFARVADDGVIGTANGVPVQLYRYRGVRQVWYFDPRTGKKLLVTIPESRSVLVPVRTF